MQHTLHIRFATAAGILLVLWMNVGSSYAASGIRAGPKNRFWDAAGRVVTLRGLNVAGRAKVPEFSPFDDLQVLDSLAVFSSNVARLPFIWEAYEPVRGQFNQTYFNYYKSVVQYLYTMGIYSMVDVHQDGFSRYLVGGCGDGFPRWAIPSRYYGRLSVPANDESCKNWKISLVFDSMVTGSWESFYKNENGVRDAFLALWDTLAKTFAGNPAILGYDILNEPVGSERRQIMPLFEDAAKVIRARDKDAILFLTPMFLLGLGGQSGMTQPTFDNYAIANHWYPQGSYTGVSTADAFDMWFKLVYPWGAPLFVGEFGAEPLCVELGAETVPALMNSMYDFFDLHLLSWTQWTWHNDWNNVDHDGWNMENYSITDEFHNIRSNFAIRPMPRAIAGTPILFQVDQRARTMFLSWNVTAEALRRNPTTTIYAPATLFFQVISPDWLNITITNTAGGTTSCSYLDQSKATLLVCRPKVVGVHTLHVRRNPGTPSYVSAELLV